MKLLLRINTLSELPTLCHILFTWTEPMPCPLIRVRPLYWFADKSGWCTMKVPSQLQHLNVIISLFKLWCLTSVTEWCGRLLCNSFRLQPETAFPCLQEQNTLKNYSILVWIKAYIQVPFWPCDHLKRRDVYRNASLQQRGDFSFWDCFIGDI